MYLVAIAALSSAWHDESSYTHTIYFHSQPTWSSEVYPMLPGAVLDVNLCMTHYA